MAYQHYQNSSYKIDPAQRDATSRNAQLYTTSRQPRNNESMQEGLKGHMGSSSMNETNRSAPEPLLGFQIDSHGNVYRKSSKTNLGSALLDKAKNLFHTGSNDDEKGKGVVR
jgi:hypothetical protein